MKNSRFHLMAAAGMITLAAARASEVHISGGSVQVDSTLAAGAVTVAAASTLTGTGTVNAAQTEVSGTVAPGAAPGAQGVLAFTGDLAFQAGSVYDCNVAAADSVDRLVVAGTVTGPGTVRVINPGGAVPVDQVIINGGPGSGYGDFAVAAPGTTNWGLAENPATDLALTRLDGDSDANGLPDWWEWTYFDQLTGNDPDGHGDTDGIPNNEEYAARTDPTDETSYLHLTWIEPNDDDIVMGWASVSSPWLNLPDPVYVVEATTNIAAVGYTDLSGELASTPPENTYTNLAPPANCFYRVGVH